MSELLVFVHREKDVERSGGESASPDLNKKKAISEMSLEGWRLQPGHIFT